MATNAKDWREALERDTDAVFQSFYALALCAPLAVCASALARRAALRSPDADPTRLSSVPPVPAAAFDLIALGVAWAASLALLLAIARRTGRTGRAADIVVGWNWIQPITIGVGLPSIALAAAGFNVAAAGFALLAVVASVGLYFGYIRRALDTETGIAIGIFVMLAMIEIIVDFLVLAIAQSFYVSG